MMSYTKAEYSFLVEVAQLAGVRGFDVAAGESLTVNLFCQHQLPDETATVGDSNLVAIYTPVP